MVEGKPHRNKQLRTPNGRRPCTADHHLQLLDPFASNLQSIDNRRSADNRCTVLIIVQKRDRKMVVQFVLYVEAVGRLNIF